MHEQERAQYREFGHKKFFEVVHLSGTHNRGTRHYTASAFLIELP